MTTLAEETAIYNFVKPTIESVRPHSYVHITATRMACTYKGTTVAVIIIISNEHFCSATNYPDMGSLVVFNIDIRNLKHSVTSTNLKCKAEGGWRIKLDIRYQFISCSLIYIYRFFFYIIIL